MLFRPPRNTSRSPLLLLAAVAIAGFFFGCGQREAKKVIQLQIPHELDLEFLHERLREFERQNPGVQVETRKLSSSESIGDVAIVQASHIPHLFESGEISGAIQLPLSSDQYLPQCLEAVMPFDPNPRETAAVPHARVSGAPFAWSVQVLYYNPQIFQQHAIPQPTSDWDWGDLQQAAKLLTVRDNEGNVLQWGLESDFSARTWLSFIFQNRGAVQQGSTWNLIDPRYIQSNEEAIGFYATLFSLEKVAPFPNKGVRDKSTRFEKGLAAMTIAGKEVGHRLSASNPNRISWEIAQVPKGREAATFMQVLALVSGVKASYPELCGKLIQFLSSETSQSSLALSGPLHPVLKQAILSPAFLDFPGPRPARNKVWLDSLKVASPSVRSGGWPLAERILEEEMERLARNPLTITPRAALIAMQARLEELRLLNSTPDLIPGSPAPTIGK
jgi:ABC-type glycerol-3-phosphate transport system substrate-binding protein